MRSRNLRAVAVLVLAVLVGVSLAAKTCPNCGESKDRSEGSWFRICPDCGAPLEVRGGDELDVLEVSFEAIENGAPEEQ